MAKNEKVLKSILGGSSDANIRFEDLKNLMLSFGFAERVKSSHHIFYREDVEEIINIQSKAGKAKPYQVKQVRSLIKKYNLSIRS